LAENNVKGVLWAPNLTLEKIAMKKTLIALAVLATSGAAMAQSTFTLFGVADAWVGSLRTQTATVNTAGTGTTLAGPRQMVLNSGGRNGSRWGLRGSEDLGGGLKALFHLESGYNIDSGDQAATNGLFNRQAFVGVAGGFGEIRLGRQYTPYWELRSESNNNNDTAFAPTDEVWGNQLTAASLAGALDANGLSGADATTFATAFLAVATPDYSLRQNNQITYRTPNISGVTGVVSYAFGENKADAAGAVPAQGATPTFSLKVQYNAGPLMVGFAHQNQKARVAGVNTDSTKFNMLAGSYDLGMAKITGGFNATSRGNFTVLGVTDGIGSDKEFQLGVAVPVGSLTLYGGFAQSKFDSDLKSKGFGFSADYALSKRTNAYAGFRIVDTKLDGTKTAKSELLAVGLRHAF
jgi:predicted porin